MNQARMDLWKERLQKNQAAMKDTFDRMDERDELYLGRREIAPTTERDVQKDGRRRQARHVRNIIAENIVS